MELTCMFLPRAIQGGMEGILLEETFSSYNWGTSSSRLYIYNYKFSGVDQNPQKVLKT